MTRAAASRRLGALAFVLLVLWLILPLVPLAIWSAAGQWRFPDLLPAVWSARAWTYALSDTSGVLAALGTTTGIALAVTGLAVLIGVPAGRALGLHRFKGRAAVELVLFAPVIVPGIAVAMGLHGIFLQLGLANGVAGVVLVHLVPALPYMVLVSAGVFAAYDPAMEDEARTLGAGPLAVFRHVTLPMVGPGILAGALFAFLVSWSQYLPTLLVGGGRVTTLPLLLYAFAASGRHDVTGAIALITVVPGILVLAIAARRLTGRNAVLGAIGRS